MNPFYLEAVEAYLDQDTIKLNSLLYSNRLTRYEKELLKARIEIREKNWMAAEESLKSLHIQDVFLNAERYFLLANIAGFNANWEDALMMNEKAHELYKTCEHARGLFLTSYNLSVDYSALGLFQISAKFLKQAQILAENQSQKSQILRALAWNEMSAGKNAEALNYVEQGMVFIDSVQPSEKSMFLAVAADVYFRCGNIEIAYDLMKKLKYSKSLCDKSRIHFEFELMERIVFDRLFAKPLPFMPDEVALSKEYGLKWKVLRHLQHGETTAAEKTWVEICEMFPLYYTQGFQCLHPLEAKSVFMKYLNQLRSISLEVVESEEKIKIPTTFKVNKQSQLIQILLNSPSGIRKEDLIEQVWNEKYDTTMDAKLYKLIQRIRENSKFEIVNQNQCYYVRKPTG